MHQPLLWRENKLELSTDAKMTSIDEVPLEQFGNVFFPVDQDERVTEVALESNSRPINPNVLCIDVIVKVGLFFSLFFGLGRVVI